MESLMENQNKFSKWKESTTLRLLVIGFLVLLLLIPIGMVNSLIGDRGWNKQKVSQEIFNSWGNTQVLKGPIVTIPYNSYYWNYYEQKLADSNKTITKKELKKRLEYAHFLPNKLLIDGKIDPSIRYRSIYEVVVYKGIFKIQGFFSKPDMSEWQIKPEDILFDLATISFGISDLRGVEERIKLIFDGKESFFNPGIKLSQVSKAIKSGVSIPVKFDSNKENIDFSFELKLRGSQSILFFPYGKESVVNLKSSWSNPSFIGDFLPSNRKIDKNGFSAKWKVVDINRAYPQNFRGQDIKRLGNVVKNSNYTSRYNYKRQSNHRKFYSSFGVDLKIPVDYYQKSDRSLKYGVLIIILTFITFFFVEIFLRKAIHPFQYILVGFGLVLFFALLISFSEHFGFDIAYIISSIATISSISLYSITVFRDKKSVIALFAVMALFYNFIYILLQMQDYSLILGTTMLFVTLSSIMYISRNIDWYNIKKIDNEECRTGE